MAAITADGRQELIALYLTMFGTAPTTVKLAEMVVARENGSTVFQVAASLATDPGFALVASKDADSFATYLADALLASDIPASARAWAINWVVTQVSGTKTKAQVIAEAVQAIRATTNTNYASSKAELSADVTAALVVIDNPPVEIKTFTLTANADTGTSFTGTSGNDMYVGQISGDLGTGTTFTAGDALNGGNGTDTLSVTVAGAATGAVTSTATTLTGIERVEVSNFESSTNNHEFNGALWTGVSTVALTASSATGDTSFTNLKSVVAAEMKNGAGDLSVSYITGVGAGTADTQTLALEGVTAGAFTAAAAMETVAITGTGSNTLTTLTASGATKLTINSTGTTTITDALPTTIKTIDSSASAGGTSLVVGTVDVTVTGGAGNDSLRIDGATVDTNDSINAGAGTDTLTLTGAIASATAGARVANFESVRYFNSAAAAGATTFTQDMSFISGITSVGISRYAYTDDNDTTADTASLAATFSNMAAGQTMAISGISTSGDADDNGAVTVGATFSLAADTTADSGTLSLGSAFGAAVSAGANNAVTFNVTASDYETLTINAAASSTTSNTISTLTASDLTTLNIAATRPFTITTLTAGAVKTIDGSTSTGDLNIPAATLASTVTGGSGNDTLNGGANADSISGGVGNDSLVAGGGADTVYGGVGNDTITGGAGNDKLYGEDGDDRFTDAEEGSSYIEGGAGNDTFVVSTFGSLTTADTIMGGDGTDTLEISADADVNFTTDITQISNVTGVERISFTGFTAGRTVTFNDGVVSTAGGTLTLLNSSNQSSTWNGSGVLSNASKVVYTQASTVTTAQTFSIGNGVDHVTFGTGGDTLVVSKNAYLSASDTLNGGTGSDTLSFTDDTAGTINHTATTLANIASFETFSINSATDGNAINYSFTLTDAAVGNQVAVGSTFTVSRDSSDTGGTLKVDGSAVTTNYVLSLSGAGAKDTLTGGAGNDTLAGGAGQDSLTGGAGNDTFSFVTSATATVDTIADFSFGSSLTSVDVISVTTGGGGWAASAVHKATTGGTVDARVIVLDTTAYTDLEAAEAAAAALQGNAANADYLIVWQDTLGTVHVSFDGDKATDSNTEAANALVDLAKLTGLTIVGVSSAVNIGDFAFA